MSPNANRLRLVQGDTPHLVLVPPLEETVRPVSDDSRPTGRHAAPTSRAIAGNAVTLRALLALGALLATIGMSMGRADAMMVGPELEQAEPELPKQPLPDTHTAPATPTGSGKTEQAPARDTATTPEQSTVRAAAPRTRVRAATPATAPVTEETKPQGTAETTAATAPAGASTGTSAFIAPAAVAPQPVTPQGSAGHWEPTQRVAAAVYKASPAAPGTGRHRKPHTGAESTHPHSHGHGRHRHTGHQRANLT